MRFYGIPWDDLMRLPIRIFWLLNKNMERSKAQENIRIFRLLTMQHADQDIRQEFLSEQRDILGSVVKERPGLAHERDEEGVRMLKRMAKGLPV